ncbi:hypothetical protein [Aureimonas mangrovi]|uniref:hypothetical protein n=1 Tax=Aureimonas mangrovi TaxID=2758041 RepID=UPI001AED850A|nr:hypothetical protein [Aureimonas mangrovi]
MRDHQTRVGAWMIDCFGEEVSADKTERADRFIEEALELAQATGWTADRGHALVDYVFGRPVGEPGQEVGGVMVTLAALCNVHGIDIDAEARREVDRITQPDIVLKIRAKQAAKPTGSALPVATASAVAATALSPAQREIARHALGLDGRRRQSYRNHYVAGEGGDDFVTLREMVEAGFARQHRASPLSGGDPIFTLTRAGAERALDPGENLKPEHFPIIGAD